MVYILLSCIVLAILVGYLLFIRIISIIDKINELIPEGWTDKSKKKRVKKNKYL